MKLYMCVCAEIFENNLDGLKVIEPPRFSSEKFNRGIFPQKVGGTTVLVLWISSDDTLYLYQVL